MYYMLLPNLKNIRRKWLHIFALTYDDVLKNFGKSLCSMGVRACQCIKKLPLYTNDMLFTSGTIIYSFDPTLNKKTGLLQRGMLFATTCDSTVIRVYAQSFSE